MPIGLPEFSLTLDRIYLINCSITNIHAHEVSDLTLVKRFHIRYHQLQHVTDLRHFAADLELDIRDGQNMACDSSIAWVQDVAATWDVFLDDLTCQSGLVGNLDALSYAALAAEPSTYVAPQPNNLVTVGTGSGLTTWNIMAVTTEDDTNAIDATSEDDTNAMAVTTEDDTNAMAVTTEDDTNAMAVTTEEDTNVMRVTTEDDTNAMGYESTASLNDQTTLIPETTIATETAAPTIIPTDNTQEGKSCILY